MDAYFGCHTIRQLDNVMLSYFLCGCLLTDPDMDRLLRLGGGMPGLGQVA